MKASSSLRVISPLLVSALFPFLCSCGSGETSATESAGRLSPPGPAGETAARVVESAAAAAAPETPQGTASSSVFVVMETSMGDIVLELDAERAPISVENFITYVDIGFYEETIFHRVINNFMIQGGGFTADLTKKATGAPITNEWRNGLKNERGTIAMARTRAPNSATSQFYISVKDNPSLVGNPPARAGYAVFGRVAAGMDVVDQIRGVPTGLKKGRQDVPIVTVTIVKVRRIDADEARRLAEAEAG